MLGRADAPLVLDVRRDERFRESERILPGARRCAPQDVPAFASGTRRGRAIVYCVHGLEVSQQAAADLRAAGWDAVYLQGGIEGWSSAACPPCASAPTWV